jgi:hypothetical protein
MAGVGFAKEGNCFTDIAGASGFAKIAATLSVPLGCREIGEVRERWVYRREQSNSSAGRGPSNAGERGRDADRRPAARCRPVTFGDPMRPLLWVSKSHDKLAAVLCGVSHKISAVSMKRLPRALGYSRQINRMADKGSKHPDRDA